MSWVVSVFTCPWSRMALVAELSFLLFALISNIRGEERIILRYEGESYTFRPPKEANYCLISRFVGEEKLVLWNTSALQESENSTAPEDLKRRLAVVRRANVSSYRICNLTHSDSSQYQEECWGNVTHEKNISMIICKTTDETKFIYVRSGETLDLPCQGAADGQDVQWLRFHSGYWESFWTRVSRDSETTAMADVEGRPQVGKTTSRLRIFNFTSKIDVYVCLTMNRQQCVSSHPVELFAPPETIYHAVQETAVLQCPVSDFNDDQPPIWTKLRTREKLVTSFNNDPAQLNQSVINPNSLVLPSLTLNHSGIYSCQTHNRQVHMLYLVVCPESGPPAVKLVSEGDNVTFTCSCWREGTGHQWFIRSNQTEGRLVSLLNVAPDLRGRLDRFNASLVLYNVSLEDAGDYWCAVTDRNDSNRCVSTAKSLLQFREPPGFHVITYTVRSSLLTALLLILCVTVVAVRRKFKRGEQHSPETHS